MLDEAVVLVVEGGQLGHDVFGNGHFEELYDALVGGLTEFCGDGGPVVLVLVYQVNQPLHILFSPLNQLFPLLIRLNSFQVLFEIRSHEHRLNRTLLKIRTLKHFRKVLKLKTPLTEDVAACHLFEDVVDGTWLKLLGSFFVVPLVVVAYIAAKVAEGCVAGGDSFYLLGGDDEEVALRPIGRDYLAIRVAFHLLVENILYSLGLGDIDVALGCGINDLRADVATFTEGYFWRSQIWLHIEVDEPPVLKECVQSNNGADITGQFLAAFGC